jgi:hypothetical protein
MYFTKPSERRTIGGKQSESNLSGGLAVLSSGIIDLAIGLTFVFGVTAALASVVTEMVARFIGLRGAYLLGGLRELVDGNDVATDLKDAQADYDTVKSLVESSAASAAEPPPAEQAPAEQATPDQTPPQQAPPEQPSGEQTPPTTPSATGALLGGPILSNQGMAGQIFSRKLTLAASGTPGRLPKMTLDQDTGSLLRRIRSLWSLRRSLPSYISASSFADAVIDLVVPDPKGQTTMTTIQQGIAALPDMVPFKPSLQALTKNAEGDINRFRASVEQWYDDHMDRVSGWYKRHVAVITLVFGAILVVLLNINALTIGRTLYTESAISTAVSSLAVKDTNCPTVTLSPSTTSTQRQEHCLEELQGQLSAAASAGLPIGWGTVRDCTEPGAHCNWLDQRGIFSRHGDSFWQLVLVLIGFVIMIIALVPGAQFWFGLLTMLGSLRASGPKPSGT